MISAKRISAAFTIIFTLFCAAPVVLGQAPPVPLPRPSQKASAMQTIGVTDVSIIYSRPQVKGRTIFADAPPSMAARAKGEATLDNQNLRQKGEPIVPWGHVWRTGANEATEFIVTDDVVINGQPLKAGTYSLHTIPDKDEWTVIFNSDPGQWGSFSYDSAKDVLRVKAKPQMAADNQEWLMYTFDPVSDNSAQVNIRWEKMRVPFTVEVKDVRATTLAKLRTVVAAAKPDDWSTPFQAGRYALQNKDTDEGMRWLDQSIKVKATFQNLSAKARALFSAGRKDEALALADQAIAKGKADKVDTAAFEKQVADMKAGKM